MAVQQMVPVACPNCGAQFTAPVESIVSASDAALKSALLQGRLNTAQCPRCSFTSTLNVPILYHDAEKELAYALVPNGLQVAGPDQEKMIGKLANTLMNSLPAEQRKFYILNPKIFLSLESMVKAILESEGITEEMLETQAAKVKLIEEFLKIDNEAAFKEKVKEHDAELDEAFFEVLTVSIQAAQMEGNMSGAQALFGLRTALARFSSQGRKIVKEIDQRLGLVFLQNQEELLEKMQSAKDDQELESWVAAGLAMLDYNFFQQLTARIDQAEKEGNRQKAAELKTLRAKVLEIKDRYEEMSRAALKKASELLKEVLQSRKPDKVLEQNLDKIDQAFFVVLSANIEEARRQKQEQAAQAMEMIGDMAMSMVQARLAKEAPPQPEEEQPAGKEPEPSSEILISKR
jgi:hypothetical protein